MANYKVSDTDLTTVANAIRTKGGTSASLEFPDGFASAISNIPSGGGSTLITKSITANGTYNASSDNADGYSSVSVAVPVLFTKVGEYTLTEAWSANYTGKMMLKNALADYYSSSVMAYLLIFRNNAETGSYRVDMIVCSKATSDTDIDNAQGFMYRNYYASAYGIGSSAKAASGTVIDIYTAGFPS